MGNVSHVTARRFVDGAADSTTSIAAAQTIGAPGNLIITGAAATFGTANQGKKVSITSTANFSTTDFTIRGTSPNGQAVAETVRGLNNNTILSVNYYNTVTQLSSSTALATNVSAGVSGNAGCVYPGRTRVRGMSGDIQADVLLTFSDVNPAAVVIDTATGWSTAITRMAVDVAAGQYDPYIPDNGLLFKSASYVEWAEGGLAVKGLTIFFDG
jgi:hypothetical protein